MSEVKVEKATKPAPDNSELDAAARHARDAKRHRATMIVVSIGFIVVAALFIFMVTRPPTEDPRPVSLGFSFNSFFRWLGDMGPIVQIPIVLVVFAAVVARHPAAHRVRAAAREPGTSGSAWQRASCSR